MDALTMTNRRESRVFYSLFVMIWYDAIWYNGTLCWLLEQAAYGSLMWVAVIASCCGRLLRQAAMACIVRYTTA